MSKQKFFMSEEIAKLKKELLPLSGNERGEFLRSLKYLSCS